MKSPMTYHVNYPDSKVHGANMGPNWVLSAPDGPRVGPMNLAIREAHLTLIMPLMSEWVIKFNGLSRTAVTEVHVLNEHEVFDQYGSFSKIMSYLSHPVSLVELLIKWLCYRVNKAGGNRQVDRRTDGRSDSGQAQVKATDLQPKRPRVKNLLPVVEGGDSRKWSHEDSRCGQVDVSVEESSHTET